MGRLAMYARHAEVAMSRFEAGIKWLAPPWNQRVKNRAQQREWRHNKGPSPRVWLEEPAGSRTALWACVCEWHLRLLQRATVMKTRRIELNWIALNWTNLYIWFSWSELNWIELSWIELSYIWFSWAELSWIELSYFWFSWTELK